jgi:hypothetical protein
MFGAHASVMKRGENVFPGLLGLEFESGGEVASGSQTGCAGSEQKARITGNFYSVAVFTDVLRNAKVDGGEESRGHGKRPF